SAFARNTGAVVFVVGLIGVAAWLYAVVRAQQALSSRLGSGGFSGSASDDVDLLDRLDSFAPYVTVLVLAALVTGLGVLLRLVADVVADRFGGTVTGYEPGDTIDESEPI